jgi:hypothetical protein
MDGHIDIGRGSNVPQLITCRVESVKYESAPVQNLLRVSGRCWGERLFRRVVTKTYENKKGEDIIRDLIDNYVGLGSYRGNTALTSDAAAGQKGVFVANTGMFEFGDPVKIEDDNASEFNVIDFYTSSLLNMVNDLIHTYTTAANGKVWKHTIEPTDTTYTKLEYENTPVIDILRFIAASADKSGVIGFDFRVAPDAKFEFFPRNSKTSPVSLSEKIEVSEYRKDIHGIRNKITVYGAADKSVPSDKDAWTESLNPSDGSWSAGAGEVSLESSSPILKGSASIKVYGVNLPWIGALLTLNAGKEVNANLYPILNVNIWKEAVWDGSAGIILYDTSNKSAAHYFSPSPAEWINKQVKVGEENADLWDVESGFDWTNIKKPRIECWDGSAATGSFWIDGLFFGGRRYSSTQEDSSSQTSYGLRELVEVDEELYSDAECQLRAKALLAHLKDPAEYLTVTSTVIDYGSNPLLAGDKIPVVLPNENVNSDFRILSVEYFVDAKTQTLEITMKLGREVPLLADYLYALRSKTDHLSRHKIARLI